MFDAIDTVTPAVIIGGIHRDMPQYAPTYEAFLQNVVTFLLVFGALWSLWPRRR
jgi:hypothetical protein